MDSPGGPEGRGGLGERRGRREGAIVLLTVAGLSLAVGAETTFGSFLPSYVDCLRDVGLLHVGEAEADLMTSAFWAAFTFGRLGGGVAVIFIPPSPTDMLSLPLQVCLSLPWQTGHPFHPPLAHRCCAWSRLVARWWWWRRDLCLQS